MRPSVYLETTIPSFLSGEPSPVIVTAAHQMATRYWWTECRDAFELFVSMVVIEEISRGSSPLVEDRLRLVEGLPRLAVTEEVVSLAARLRTDLNLPDRAATDSLHIAVACHHEMDYLLTWNLKHIAGAQVRRALDRAASRLEIIAPTICTPEELLEGSVEP